MHGAELIECHAAGRGLRLWWNLVKRYRNLHADYEMMFVAFPGHEIALLGRLLAWRRPIIVDVYTSHYTGYVLDRGRCAPDSLRAKYYRFMDWLACRCADVALLDTDAHIRFLRDELGIRHPRFRRVWIGSDSELFSPHAGDVSHPEFIVHYHGHYIPHHGTPVIVRAAALLMREGVRFRMVGSGQEYQKCRALAEELHAENVEFIEEVPYERMPDLLAESDVCLGVFGTNRKTGLTITNKIFEAASMAKPVITADAPAVRELFCHGRDIFLCPGGDEHALASAIRSLKEDTVLRASLGAGARATFCEHCSEDRIGAELMKIVSELKY